MYISVYVYLYLLTSTGACDLPHARIWKKVFLIYMESKLHGNHEITKPGQNTFGTSKMKGWGNDCRNSCWLDHFWNARSCPHPPQLSNLSARSSRAFLRLQEDARWSYEWLQLGCLTNCCVAEFYSWDSEPGTQAHAARISIFLECCHRCLQLIHQSILAAV